jgi:phenylacetate-CoA ligase
MIISELETKSPEEVHQFQVRELQKLLVYLKLNSKFYSELFQQYHIDITKIKSLNDLTHIPVTTKE